MNNNGYPTQPLCATVGRACEPKTFTVARDGANKGRAYSKCGNCGNGFVWIGVPPLAPQAAVVNQNDELLRNINGLFAALERNTQAMTAFISAASTMHNINGSKRQRVDQEVPPEWQQ